MERSVKLLVALLLLMTSTVVVIADTYTIDWSNTVNTVPGTYFCVHDLDNSVSKYASMNFNDGAEGALFPSEQVNYLFHRTKMLDAGVQCIRVDMDIANLCDTNELCNNTRTGVSPHNVTGGMADEVAWAAANGIRMIFISEDNPTWNSNASYKCASQSRACGPADYALHETTMENFWENAQCNVYDNCDLEIYNEPYNPYFQPDVPREDGGSGTATCDNLTRDINTMLLNMGAQWIAGPYDLDGEIMVAALYPDHPGGDSFTINECSAQISHGVWGNVTNATGTMASSHPYSFPAGVANWRSHFSSDIAAASARGYYDIAFSEFARYNSVMGQNGETWDTTLAYRDNALIFVVAMQMPQVKRLTLFPWTTQYVYLNGTTTPSYNTYLVRENNTSRNVGLDGNVTPVFWAFRNHTTYFPSGSLIKNTSITSNAEMLAAAHPNGSFYVELISISGSTVAAVINLTNFQNGTPYSLINTKNGTVHVLTNNATTNLASMTAGEVRIYEVNYSGDTTPPVITNVVNTSITSSSVQITWTTDESSNSSVNYGTTTSLGTKAGQNDAVTSHSVNISGLSPSTMYFYNVSSTDTSGNIGNATSQPRNFTTLPFDCNVYAGTTIARNTTTCYYLLNSTCTVSCSGSVYTNYCNKSYPTISPLTEQGQIWNLSTSGTNINYDNAGKFYTVDNSGRFTSTLDVRNYTNLSFSGWFKSTPTTYVTSGSVISWRSTSIALLASGASNMRCSINTTANGYTATSASITNKQDWHHAVCVYDGSNGNLSIYFDGALVTSTVVSPPGVINYTTYSSPAFGAWLGRQKGGSEANFNGSIDDVRVWNKALSASEVLAVYINDTVSDQLNATWSFFNQTAYGGCS